MQNIRVVIDTNVVLSAAWRDGLPERVVLHIAENPTFIWLASREILREYQEVLTCRKFALTSEILAQWKTTFTNQIQSVEPLHGLDFPRDPDDAPFLALPCGPGGFFHHWRQGFRIGDAWISSQYCDCAKIRRIVRSEAKLMSSQTKSMGTNVSCQACKSPLARYASFIKY